MFKYPYTAIVGQGLGVAYSSLQQTGPIYPFKGLGQANINFLLNLGNGNLVVQDRHIRLNEDNFPLEFYFTYNSLLSMDASNPAKAWQFSIKRFVQLPPNNNPGATAILQEEDGHLTTYVQDPSASFVYTAPAWGSDTTPILQFDPESSMWTWYHAGTQIVETYDANGYLRTRADREGRVTNFYYNSNGQLTGINFPSGLAYNIMYESPQMAIYDSRFPTPLIIYTFDSLGRLVSSRTSDGYETTYVYFNNTGCLDNVVQSDTTIAQIGTNNDGTVYAIDMGDNNYCRPTYASDENPNKATVQDGNGNQAVVTYDNNYHILEIDKVNAYDESAPLDVTTYTYHANGQLKTITHPNAGVDTYFYSYDNYDAPICQVEPDGQYAETLYQKDGTELRVIELIQHYDQYQNEVSENPDDLAITRFIYDTHYDDQYTFKRFKISPEGRVTEYRPDGRGNILTERVYLDALFGVSALGPHEVPTLDTMLAFVADQNPQHVKLTEHTYNLNGEPAFVYEYANVDANGEGILDQDTNEILTAYDGQGNCEVKTIKQTETISQTTLQYFDGLKRLTKAIDALGNVTRYDYDDANAMVTVTHPSNRTEVTIRDTQGQVLSRKISATNSQGQIESRMTSYARDLCGLPIETTDADGNIEFKFFNQLNYLGFTVSPSGIVSEIRRDHINRYELTIHYANPIDPTQLVKYPGILPTPEDLMTLLQSTQDPTIDRYSYDFFDKSGRVIYSVDAMLNLTQFFYDNLNQKIGSVRYKEKLTTDQLNALQSGQTLNLIYNPKQDHCVRVFYDRDGLVVGEQDAAGYLTEYKRDAGGRIWQKVVYYTPVDIDLSVNHFSDIVIPPSDKNEVTSYFHDNRGRVIAEIDPENCFIQYTYYKNGAKKSETRYATKTTTISPTPPISSIEDQVKTYELDLLDRPVVIDLPYQTIANAQYDNMGNVLSKGTFDATNPTNTDGDSARGTQQQYDGWGQVIREANPYVNQLLLQAQTDVEKQDIWEEKAVQNIFGPTGLKIKSLDNFGGVTYYYYDSDRRLVMTIDPKKSIEEMTLNSFGEVVATRGYDTAVPDDLYASLTGGFLVPAVKAQITALRNDAKDHITTTLRDKNGKPRVVTDSDGYQSEFKYDSFNQCIEESLPLTITTPELKISHEFDVRGLEITTRKQGSQGTVATESRQYNHPGRLITSFTNALSGITTYAYDKSEKLTSETNALGLTRKILERDGLGRVLSETDYEENGYQHSYNQQQRSHATQLPVAGASETTTANVYGETIKKIDSLGNAKQWQHEPDGQVRTATNELGNSTQETHDLAGKLRSHTDEQGVATQNTYDAAQRLEQQIFDAGEGNANLTTTYQRDNFGNPIDIINPRNVHQVSTFNKRNLVQTSTIDPVTADNPQGLNVVTTQGTNGQGAVISTAKGDATNPTQWTEATSRDDLNRKTGNIVDPTGLAINNKTLLNAAGDTIAVIDPLGHTTWQLRDTLGQKRFEVNARGSITEWVYDNNQREIKQLNYRKNIDPTQINKNTTIAELAALVKTDPQDCVNWVFRDEMGYERFTISKLGVVKEKRYNKAFKITETIHYKTKIPTADLDRVDTAYVASLMAGKTSSRDKHLNYILDEAGQERYIIDPENYIIEQEFDARGKIIRKTAYASPVPNPADLSALNWRDVNAHLIRTIDLDRTTYNVFNSKGKPWFTVNAVGHVTRFDYDESYNLVKTIGFAQKFVATGGYDAMVTQLKSLVPDPKTDRIHEAKFDNADRRDQDITYDYDKTANKSLALTDTYKLNALGDIDSYTDANNAKWTYGYDRARRLEKEITPAYDNAIITLDAATGTLTKKIVNQSVIKFTERDSASNETAITQAHGTEKSRKISFNYDENNQLTGTCLHDATIDINKNNPNQDTVQASFTARPEVKTDLTRTIVYDFLNRKVAEQDEDENWHFHVYDADGNEIYEVMPNKGVIRRYYDAFGNKIAKVVYDSKIGIDDLSQYTKTGIPLEKFSEPGVIVTSPTDRISTVQYDKRDYETQTGVKITTDENVDINPSTILTFYRENLNDTPHYGNQTPRTKRTINAFGNCIKESKLIYSNTDNNTEPSKWSDIYRWFDGANQIIAETDAINNPTIIERNTFGDETRVTQYANQLTGSPAAATTLAELIKLLNPDSAHDRVIEKEYNLRGLPVNEMYRNIVIQQVTIENGRRVMKEVTVPIANRKILYNAKNLPIVLVDEAGATIYQYYNSIGKMIARTGVARSSKDNANQAITIIPLMTYGIDPFGVQVSEERYLQGTNSADENNVPTPKEPDDPNNQYEMQLMNNFGLQAQKQDAKAVQHGTTYTATRQIARMFINRTNPKEPVHMDEERHFYDRMDKPTLIRLLEDNHIVQETSNLYNTFAEKIAEGANDGKTPKYWRYNAAGYVYSTNEEKGVVTISLPDLMGRNVLQFKSTFLDLSTYNEEDISKILGQALADSKTFVTRESLRDARGDIGVKIEPGIPADKATVTNLPACMQVRTPSQSTGACIVAWAIPQEKNVSPSIVFKTRDGTTTLSPAPTISDGYYTVDVSNLPTDIYTYEITYTCTIPIANGTKQFTLYTTQGDIQITTKNNTSNVNVVTSITKDSLLYFSGNTTGLNGVTLLQNGQVVAANLPLSQDPSTHQYFVDLTSYPSGMYTVQPLFSNNRKEGVSLPFTLYTPTPSPVPLSREITSNVSLSVTNTDGVLTWTVVPEQYNTDTVKIAGEYLGEDNLTYVLPDTLVTRDQEGKFTFENPVKSIVSLALSVQLPNQEWLELFSGIAPVSPFNQLSQLEPPALYTWSESDAGKLQKRYFRKGKAGIHGEDGFTLLKTNRKTICDTIKPLLAKPEVKQAFSEDIYLALQAGVFAAPDSNWNSLRRKHRVAEDELVIAKDRGNFMQDETALKEIALAEATAALKAYSMQPNVQLAYFQQLGEDQPLGWHTALLYARTVNQPLAIWSRNSHFPTEIKLLGAHQSDEAHKINFLLYSNGLHYQSICAADSHTPAAALTSIRDSAPTSHLTTVANFAPQTTLYFVPFKFPAGEIPNIVCKNDKSDILTRSIKLPCMGITNEGTSYNVTGMPAGIYTYTYNEVTQTFIIALGGQVYASNSPLNVPLDQENQLRITRPYHVLTYDRWRNPTQEVDMEGHVISRTYNKRNALLNLTMPETDVIGENGLTTRMTPVKKRGYDLVGNLIAIQNANGFIELHTVDEAGQLLQVSVDDDEKTIVTNKLYDGFGRVWKKFDSRNNPTYYTWDKGNCVTAMKLPSGRTYNYGFSEKNLCTSIKDPGNELPLLQYYNVNTDLIRTDMPDGVTSLLYEYERNHLLTKQYNEQHQPIVWQRDYFGNVIKHIDLSRAEHTPEYDRLFQPLSVHSTGGDPRQMIVLSYYHLLGYTFVGANSCAVSAKNMQYEYHGDLLVSMVDKSIKAKSMTLQYDYERRPVVMDCTNDQGELIRHVEARYDEHGRDSYQLDREMIVVRGYDAEGNIRFTNGSVYSHGFDKHPLVSASWNRFDAANRVLQQDGQLQNAMIVGGQLYTYKNNLRDTETDQAKVTQIRYDDDSQLTDTASNNGETSHREYDPSGWIKAYQGKGVFRNVTSNANGWITADVQHVGNPDDPVSSTNYSDFVCDGLPQKIYTVSKVPNQKNITDDLKAEYVSFDSKLPSKTSGTRSYDGKSGNVTAAELLYDANGASNAVFGSYSRDFLNQPALEDPYSFYLLTTPEGTVIAKETIETINFYNLELFPVKPRFEYFSDIHSNVMGVYSKNYAQVGDIQYVVGGKGGLIGQFLSQQGVTRNLGYDSVQGGNAVARTSFGMTERLTMPALARPVAPAVEQVSQPWSTPEGLLAMAYAPHNYIFASQSYAVSGMSFPPMGPQYYVVKAGDTWESIAEMRYQDADRAEKLAEENGMIGGQLSSALEKAKPKITVLKQAADPTNTFIRYPVLADGDCGYTAIEITRENAYVLLMLNAEAIKNRLSEAVKEQLLNWEFIVYACRNKYVDTQLINAYVAYQAASERNTLSVQIEQALFGFSDNTDLVRAYLKYDLLDKQIDRGYAHPLVLHAIAHLRGQDLKIWQCDAAGRLVPQSAETTEHATCMHLLYTRSKQQGAEHFDRLVEVRSLTPTQYAALQVEGLTQSSNALGASSPLRPGMRIRTPYELPQHYNAWSHLTIDSLQSYIVGTLCPKLNMPKQDDDDGFFTSVLPEMAGVIAGAIVAWLMPESAGLVMTMIAAGTAAALTDAVVQEVQVQLGVRDHFTLREAIDVGLSSAITAGFLSPETGIFRGFTQAAIAKQFLEAGMVSIIIEFKSMMVDKTKKFSLQEVLANTFAIVVSSRVTTSLKENYARTATANGSIPVSNAGIANLLPSMYLRMQLYLANTTIDTLANVLADPEHVSMSRIAARSIGQAVGDTIVDTAETVGAQLMAHTEAAMDGSHRELKRAADAEAMQPSENRTKRRTANDGMMERQRETRTQRWNGGKDKVPIGEYNNQNEADGILEPMDSQGSSGASAVNGRSRLPVGYIKHDEIDFVLGEVTRTMPNSTINVLASLARDTRQDIRSLMFGNRAERIETVESIGKGILITAALGVAGRMMGLVIDSILEAKASGELAALFRYEGNAARRTRPLRMWRIRGSIGGEEKTLNEVSPFKLNPTESLSMSKSQFQKFIKEIKENGIKEPIKYVEHNGEAYVVDGHHRLQAAKSLGMKSVPVEKVQLPYKGYKDESDLLTYFGP